ncbi:MAG TPA: hypothetical protein VNB49_09395 [Candidatus Dormibacteraeota bacterium]|nr:hypothetical protein [Candidatus Dormibacteraeota bacterium]
MTTHKMDKKLLCLVLTAARQFFRMFFLTSGGGRPFVLLHLLLAVNDTEDRMARYSSFLGRRVEVQYRAGDILLPASGIFVADSGRSIFLEQNFEQHGKHGHFRWEIPYQCLVRIQEKPDSGATANAASVTVKPAARPEPPIAAKSEGEPRSAALASAAAVGSAASIVPLNQRTKTA